MFEIIIIILLTVRAVLTEEDELLILPYKAALMNYRVGPFEVVTLLEIRDMEPRLNLI